MAVSTKDIKIGDRVKLLVRSGGDAQVGDIGVVALVGSSGIGLSVDFPAQQRYSTNTGSVELLKPFKKGDRVRCIATGKRGKGWKEGYEFVIGETYDNIAFDGLDGQGVYFNSLALVEQATPEETKPISTKELDELTMDTITLTKHQILGQDKLHAQLNIAVQLDMPVLIVGDTGTGKTTIVKSIAEKHNQEWIRFNLTGETTVDEFVGKYVLREQETIWEDGVLLHAMKSGKWLIVDEVNVALPEILFVLHSLLDDDRSVMVSNHQGEVVSPHEDFRFFGTMNPVDEYAGTKDLNKAFKSRFGMILNMDYPDAVTEAQIVAGKGSIDLDKAQTIVDVGARIRKAKRESEVYYTCSTRDLIQWASLVGELGIVDAFEVAIMNKANGDGVKIAEIFKQVFTDYEQAVKQGHEFNLERIISLNEQLKAKQAQFDAQQDKLKEEIKEELIAQMVGVKQETVTAVKAKTTAKKKPVKRKTARK